MLKRPSCTYFLTVATFGGGHSEGRITKQMPEVNKRTQKMSELDSDTVCRMTDYYWLTVDLQLNSLRPFSFLLWLKTFMPTLTTNKASYGNADMYLRKKISKIDRQLCGLCFSLLSSLVNHLRTIQIQLQTFGGSRPQVGNHNLVG